MHLIKTISTKPLAQTTAGELVKITSPNGRHFGIVLADYPQGKIVAFLEPMGDAPYPVFRRMGEIYKCLSYGLDWIAEPIPGEESWAANRKLLTVAGALLLDAGSLWLALQPNPEDHNSTESYFDLLTNKLTDKFPEDFTPFLKWRIWESKEEYLRAGAKPLIEISAVVGR
jgi:hypothetical protein